MRRTLALAALVLLGLPASVLARPGDADRRFSGDGLLRLSVGDGSSEVYSLAAAPGGKVVAAGPAEDGVGVVRLTRRGRIDRRFRKRTFGSNGGIVEVAVHRGRPLVAWTTPRGRTAIRRLRRRDGRIDRRYGVVILRGALLSMAKARTGALLVLTTRGLQRVSRGGRRDLRFGTKDVHAAFGAGYRAGTIALDAQGRILVAGVAIDGDAPSVLSVTRLTRAGAPDAGFGVAKVATQPGLGGYPTDTNAVAAGPDGTVVVAGDGKNVARFDADGALDPAFGLVRLTGTRMPEPIALHVTRSGSVLVAGDGERRGEPRMSIARLTAAGAVDAGFGTRGAKLLNPGRLDRSSVNALLVRRGRALLGGAASDEYSDIREDFGARHFAFGAVRLR